MDAVERVWQELRQASSCGSSGMRLPLASFQFPKKEAKGSVQRKVFNIHQTLVALPLNVANSVPSKNDFAGVGAEGARPSSGKTVYSLDCWQFVGSTVQRQVNILKEECNNSKRHGALATLNDLFLEASVPNAFYNRAFTLLLDPLLLCLSEPFEVSRHIAACLLLKFLAEVADIDAAVGDVLRALVSRFGSRDIEGVAHLPPAMRPTPEYKPLQLTPVEKSEEVRQTLLQVLQTVLSRTSDKSTWGYLDLIVGLIRAATMDHCHEVKFSALQIAVEFFDRHQNMLLHFTEPVARSILSCLVHQHARIRMGALRALTHVLACGQYKYNGDIIQMLAGWRDPNVVPIKALYETTTVRNYFAELLADQSPMVRMFFFDTIAWWLLEFKDKADYETWLFPYLLSGLFDAFRPIQQLVFRLLEHLGKQYEATHEEDLRDIKQLGSHEPWSYGGQACLPYPLGGYWEVAEGNKVFEETEQFVSFVSTYTERLQSLGFDGYSLSERQKEKFTAAGGALVGNPPRPCIGTRMMVRTYFRRYANTLFQHVEDFKEVTMAASARLMVISFAFIEEACVEWLDSALSICCRVLAASHRTSPEALEAYKVVARLIGAFADPEIYWDFVRSALDGPSVEEVHDRVAKVDLLALMLEGAFAVLQKATDLTLGLGRLKPVLPKIAEALCYTQLLQEQYVSFAADSVTKVLQVLIPGANRQRAELSLTTWHHLLGVICSLATPGSTRLEADESNCLAPHLQDLLDDLTMCNRLASNGLSDRKETGTLWHLVRISSDFQPSNLSALDTYVRCLPCVRLCEENTFELIFAMLQELSAATQNAGTRRRARRVALRLVKRLVVESPPSSQSNEVDGSASTTQLNYAPPALKGKCNCGNPASREPAEVHTCAKEQEERIKSSDIQNELQKSPIQAAAKILTSILLNKLSELDFVDDLEDTLVALTEFFTMPKPQTSAVYVSMQETLEASGFILTLGRFLQDPALHTRLFCLACEGYAHECADKYPETHPAKALEDMPLGRRRELRLSAIRAAAALKDQAVLLIRLSLPLVTESFGGLKCLVNSLIKSLHPPSKLQQLHKVHMGKDCDASSNKICSCQAETGLEKACGKYTEKSHDLAEDEAGEGDKRTAVRCNLSLPFQPQSHWLLFQIASCLWDAVNAMLSCHVGLGNSETDTQLPRAGAASCHFHSLIMPRTWHMPVHGQLQLDKAGRLLHELCTETELSQALDSCVRQIVELQESTSAEYEFCTEKFESNVRRCQETIPNLDQVVAMAKQQVNNVPAKIQKQQAALALCHVIRLLGSVCPSAVQECIRQYDCGGHFSRREALVRLLDKPSTTMPS